MRGPESGPSPRIARRRAAALGFDQRGRRPNRFPARMCRAAPSGARPAGSRNVKTQPDRKEGAIDLELSGQVAGRAGVQDHEVGAGGPVPLHPDGKSLGDGDRRPAARSSSMNSTAIICTSCGSGTPTPSSQDHLRFTSLRWK